MQFIDFYNQIKKMEIICYYGQAVAPLKVIKYAP